MTNPVIFLDIDGVLNSIQYAVAGNRWRDHKWDPYRDKCCRLALSNLEELVKDIPDLRIVISSTWRLGRTVEQLQDLFKMWKFSKPEIIIGKTPTGLPNKSDDVPKGYTDVPRGAEIQHYINQHHITNFCIIDDDSDMLKSQLHRFVQTDNRNGFMWTDMQKVGDILGVSK